MRGGGVGVSETLIALLVNSNNGSSGAFDATVSASTVRELRKIVDQLFQEGIGSISRSLEENRGNKRSADRIVDKLDFKVETFSVNCVFRGGVESQLLQNVVNSLVIEGVTILLRNRSGEKVSSIEQSNTVGFVVTDVKGDISASGGLHGRDDVKRGLL